MKLHMWGFTNFDTVKISENEEKLVDIEVWLGKDQTVGGYIKKDVFQIIHANVWY